MKAADYCVFQP